MILIFNLTEGRPCVFFPKRVENEWNFTTDFVENFITATLSPFNSPESSKQAICLFPSFQVQRRPCPKGSVPVLGCTWATFRLKGLPPLASKSTFCCVSSQGNYHSLLRKLCQEKEKGAFGMASHLSLRLSSST